MTHVFKVAITKDTKVGEKVPASVSEAQLNIWLKAGIIKAADVGMTVNEYVDRYIEGEWRDGAPADVEQFAINHAAEIEAEFQARA